MSLNWLQICSYPLLWKSLYLNEGWTVAYDVLEEFETKLNKMQANFDRHHARLRSPGMQQYEGQNNPFVPPPSGPEFALSTLYKNFFDHLQFIISGNHTFSHLARLKSKFSDIARIEVGESFYRSAMFTFNNNGCIRIHVNWHYLYKNRNLLEDNWRGGCYEATLVDGAPDVSEANQREGIYCVYFDRKYLAAGARDHRIRLWDMATMKYNKTLHSHEASVLCLQLDSQRNMLVSGSSDSTIKVWDIEKGEVVQTLRGHKESVLGLHFDEKYIVSCSKDTTARIWGLSYVPGKTEDGEAAAKPMYSLLHILRGHRAAVNSVYIRANTIATASGDRSVRLWNLHTGDPIRTITAHSRGIACVNITGDLIVTGSSDHVIKLFDITTGLEVRTLRGHSSLVRTIQTDNTKIISGSYDQSIRIWDIKTGEMLQELERCHDSK